ncbi:hypothetical protein IAT38_006361 [Cryptococcus sp. DSM 104549]
MGASIPADGQIVAIIIELLDRDPRPSAQFDAPAISLPQLAFALRTSPSSISALHAADLIRPLAESLFDRPREPVVRKVRRGLVKGEWIVFEAISRPGRSPAGDALQHKSDRLPRPGAGTAPSTPTRSKPILPRPPLRRARSTERTGPIPQEDPPSLPPKTLHLIPTLPGGEEPPVSARAQGKEKGFMRALGLKKGEPQHLDDKKADERARPSTSRALGDTDREYERSIRRIADDPGHGHGFDPMRDVPPPTPLVMGPGGIPSGALLGLPKPRDRRGRDREREREVDTVDEDGDSTFDIISAYEDEQEGDAEENEGEGDGVGTVPLPKGKLSMVASRNERGASEDSDTASPASGSSDGTEDEEDPFALDGDEQAPSPSERVNKVEERGSEDSGEEDAQPDTRGEEDEAERYQREGGGDEEEARGDESEGQHRKERKHKHKHKHSDLVSEATADDKADSHDAEQTPPQTPWLVTAFEGLPFGPDAQELAMTDWLRERWRLIAAQVVAVLGAVYILQASGL